MKYMRFRTFHLAVSALPVCLMVIHPAASIAAEVLVEFVESRGCRVLASTRSAARMKEIATQGSVTWDGDCRNGLIDGPGVLRHQGSARESDRTRHYAFYLSGNASAGKRIGPWRRESFNKFADSDQYWTSITSIPYADGVAKDPLRQIAIRSEADFGAPFRALLQAIDRKTVSQKPRSGGVVAAPVAAAPESPQTIGAHARDSGTAGIARAPELPSAAGNTAAPFAAAPARPPTAVRATEGEDQTPLRADSLNPYGAVAMWLAQISQASTRESRSTEGGGGCVLETINDARVGAGATTVQATEPLRIHGRAATPPSAPNPQRAWLRFASNHGAPLVVVDIPGISALPGGAARPGEEANSNAGFQVALAAGRLSRGEYTLSVVQQRGNDFSVCGSSAKLRIG